MEHAKDKTQHRPSVRHTLDDVLHSLQDLVGNELADAAPAAAARASEPPRKDRDSILNSLKSLISDATDPAAETYDDGDASPAPEHGLSALEAELRQAADELDPGTDLSPDALTAAESPPAAGDKPRAPAAVVELFRPPSTGDAEPPATAGAESRGERRPAARGDDTPGAAHPSTPLSALMDAPSRPADRDRQAPAGRDLDSDARGRPGRPRTYVPPAQQVEMDWGDDIPVLDQVAAPPPPMAPPPADAAGDPLPDVDRARDIAVRAVARLNIELRRCGERGLDPQTIHRLQHLLREELEQQAANMDNKRQPESH